MISTPQMMYKLIILYFLSSVKMPVSNAVVSDFILEKGYVDYFNIQKAFNELVDDKFIEAENSLRTTKYAITDEGRETLSCFLNDLSPAIKSEIREYVKTNFSDIMEMLSVSADYTRIRNNEYLVTMKLVEINTVLASISVTVSDEEMARACCRNWEEKNGDMYEYIIKQLIN